MRQKQPYLRTDEEELRKEKNTANSPDYKYKNNFGVNSWQTKSNNINPLHYTT